MWMCTAPWLLVQHLAQKALPSTAVCLLTSVFFGGLPPAGIGLKNVHCLRTVFNVAHRLADSLGNSWGLVVEVLYTLDKALPVVGPVSAGKVGRCLALLSLRLQLLGVVQALCAVAPGCCSPCSHAHHVQLQLLSVMQALGHPLPLALLASVILRPLQGRYA